MKQKIYSTHKSGCTCPTCEHHNENWETIDFHPSDCNCDECTIKAEIALEESEYGQSIGYQRELSAREILETFSNVMFITEPNINRDGWVTYSLKDAK